MEENTSLVVNSPEYQELTRMYSGNVGHSGINISEIKITHSGVDSGKFYIKDGDETKILREPVKGAIMRVRYRYFKYVQDNVLRTNEFDRFDETITLFKGKEKLISDDFKVVKEYIKENYGDMKFQTIIYFKLDGSEKVSRIYSANGTSRDNLWDYIKGAQKAGHKFDFAYETEIKTEPAIAGAVSYHVIKFNFVREYNDTEKFELLKLRRAMDNAMGILKL